jgi:uncharacterized membrane protein
MNKEGFLLELKRSLRAMSEEERREVLSDYEEHFRMGAAEGKSEDSICRALGNPRVIGKSYTIDTLLEERQESGELRATSVLRALLASISLTFFNLIFVLGPFLALLGIMAGLWAVAVSLPLTGIALMLAPLASAVVPRYFLLADLNGAFLVFAGLGTVALGVLAVIGMAQLTRALVKLVASYVKFNARIVTRRK